MERSANLVDSFVKMNTKLTRLRQHTRKLVREENAMIEGNEGSCYLHTEESDEVKIEKSSCPECQGIPDAGKKVPHISDLCSADKQRIAELVKTLAECTQEKHKLEDELSVCKSENEALQDRFQLRTSEYEADKDRLKSKLSNVTTEMAKLKIQTSQSLELLTRQFSMQESQFTKLTETVRDLLGEKMQLQNILIEREMKVSVAEAKLERMKESMEMEKLIFLKEHAKNVTQRFDKSCQVSPSCQTVITLPSYCQTPSVDRTNSKKDLPRTRQTKNKDDLEAPTTEGLLLRELFYKSSNEPEVLNIFPILPQH
ncbi:uncharacterized protein LOC107267911 [Cephus cinctus]|uniref:Uncharacterized protein LOC107267911 n=1 Tax=Cephus cinctus TaxID=211228 RepID=A0AAJ7RIE6_CEPCN|nr:uncharacterized protein LOC107267911 [Cephus cinctus]XP_024941073.1 uncharacterized protein LOC107267911 [Cephus cinctus]